MAVTRAPKKGAKAGKGKSKPVNKKSSVKKPASKKVKPAKKVVKVAKKELKIEGKALKAAQGKSLASKKYKPDTEGRKQVKRFAAPLEKFNGKKTSMSMGAQAVDAGRSSLKIKAAPKNRGK